MINKLELEAVLGKAAPFLMTKSFAPILTHFCFGGNKLVAYNDLQAIVVDFKSELECALPGTLLIKLLNSLSSNSLEVIQKAEEVTFKSGRSKIKLPSLPKEDFIFEMPDTSRCNRVKIPLEVVSGLSNCLISTSDDLANPEKSGVRMIIEDGVLEFYSSDNTTLSRFRYESSNVPKSNIDIIIPSAFCEQLIKLTKTKSVDIEELSTIDLIISDDAEDLFLIAEIDSNVTVFTRLIDVDVKTEYQDIFNGFEEKFSAWLPIPKEFHDIINRACILTVPEEKFITIMESKGKQVFIDTITKSGVTDDILDFETDLKSGRFKINPENFKRIISTMSHISFCFPNPFLAVTGCNGDFVHILAAKEID